ncbi:hypothetical protein BMETH_363_2 [methanotrophic bacterial endosymbiont of Bathymodiolus sp.]|nr:hypothetical protein BMETH_363_2 [methanotrophic bacterial endosymbiont of Bathymodiolus sp.]
MSLKCFIFEITVNPVVEKYVFFHLLPILLSQHNVWLLFLNQMSRGVNGQLNSDSLTL